MTYVQELEEERDALREALRWVLDEGITPFVMPDERDRWRAKMAEARALVNTTEPQSVPLEEKR